MKPESQDSLAYSALDFAYSGKRTMTQRQHREIQAVAREAKAANYEKAGKRRSRFWRLGPAWGRLA